MFPRVPPMPEFSQFPLLAAPDAPDLAVQDAGDPVETDAGPEDRDADDRGRADDPAMPAAAANNYRFAGLVTLIPEDTASVDRRA